MSVQVEQEFIHTEPLPSDVSPVMEVEALIEVEAPVADSAESPTLLRRHNAIIGAVCPHIAEREVTRAVRKTLAEAYIDRNTAGEKLKTFTSTMYGQFEAALEELGGVDGLEKLDHSSLAKLSKVSPLFALTSAYSAIFEANLPLAIDLGSRRNPCGILGRDELRHMAVIGLSDAITRFDPSRGTAFSTYATYWMKEAIAREIAWESRAIRLPREVHHQWSKIEDAFHTYYQEHQQLPTSEDLARETGLSLETVVKVRGQGFYIPSLNQLLGDGHEDHELQALLADPRATREMEAVAGEHPLSDQELVMMANIPTSRFLTNAMKLAIGLLNEIPPRVMGVKVHTLIDGRLVTYNQAYHRYLEATTGGNSDEIRHIAAALGSNMAQVERDLSAAASRLYRELYPPQTTT